jgi:hypothetical protein
MTTFTIRVYQPDGTPVMVPGSLGVQPQAWSGVARGGAWDADIAVFGGLEELAGLTAWLGNRLEILNADGAPVWWGDVAAVEVTANGTRRGISLDRMANRVQVRYAQPQPGGSASSADTTWAENTLSQASYGVWERRISPARAMSAAEATNYRTTALATLSEPHYTLAADGGETQAHIYCTGYWQRTKRLYYSQPAGLVQHVESGEAAPLGLGFTSSAVAFVARTDEIHSIAGYLTNFQADYRIRVSGAAQAGNNGAWLIDRGGDDRTPVAYTSNNVTFSANDDILDANSGLAFIENDDAFTVSGASNAIHNGTQLMDKAGATAVEANNTYRGGNFTSEAGATITFSRGNKVKVTGALTNEQAGNSVTVTAWGQKHYQPFTLPTSGSWTAATVEIRLRRVGGPTDGVIVQLCDDSAGVPGTVLDSATVAADDIPLEMGWVAFDLSNADTLTYGGTYGLTVARTGANHQSNYYEIDLDAGATYSGGALKQWDGATWQTPSPAADMVFRVLGAQDTGTQMANTLDAQGWAGVDVAATGVESNQYRDGETRTIDELDALLDMGTSAGLRLCARVQAGRVVQIYERPDKSLARWSYQGGRLFDLFGQAAPDGFLPAGEWVQLGDAAGLGPWARLSPVFVERAEYRAGGGLTIEPEGMADMYDTGVMQG